MDIATHTTNLTDALLDAAEMGHYAREAIVESKRKKKKPSPGAVATATNIDSNLARDLSYKLSEGMATMGVPECIRASVDIMDPDGVVLGRVELELEDGCLDPSAVEWCGEVTALSVVGVGA